MLTDASPIRLQSLTSHSSQGQTADRVLLQVDTSRTGEALVNRRLAHVAVSRGRYDAQLYTNDKAHLAGALGRSAARSRSGPRWSRARSVKHPLRRSRRQSQKQASQQMAISR
jgi:hypothetical protein